VIRLLEAELAAEGYDLVDVRVFRGGGRLQLRIYLDTTDGGITLDQCAKASRSAGMLLEEADLIAERYVIEVSSPGIRRPLRTGAHYAAAVGQRVDLRTRDRRHVKGVLEGTGPDGHVVRPLEEGAEPVVVPLGDVFEGNLDPDFDAQALINADRREKKAQKREKREIRRRGKGPRRERDDDMSDEDRTDGST
jgi:ribosome maturation factor RimP